MDKFMVMNKPAAPEGAFGLFGDEHWHGNPGLFGFCGAASGTALAGTDANALRPVTAMAAGIVDRVIS